MEVKLATSKKKSGGSKKIGRNTFKCARYRQAGKQRFNAMRRVRTLIHRLEKAGIRPKDVIILKYKLERLQKENV